MIFFEKKRVKHEQRMIIFSRERVKHEQKMVIFSEGRTVRSGLKGPGILLTLSVSSSYLR